MQKGQVRQPIAVEDGAEHLRIAFGVPDLVLHVIVPGKNRKAPLGIGGPDGSAVLDMLLSAAEFKEAPALQLLRKGREWLVLQAVGKLAEFFGKNL